jgi:hypothetical protein
MVKRFFAGDYLSARLIKTLDIMTRTRTVPQIAVVRKVLNPRRLKPLEKNCRMKRAIKIPRTFPVPPYALTPPSRMTRIDNKRYESP